MRMNSLEKELEAPNLEDIMMGAWEPESSMPWLVAMKAFEAVRCTTKPDIGVAVCSEDDFTVLKAKTAELCQSFELENPIDDKYLKEILRFGNSKLHNVSAFLGGLGAQEAVKLIMGQYVPFDNTFVYDGIHGRGTVFCL